MAAADEQGSWGDHSGGQWEDRRAHKRISLDAEVWIGQDGLFSQSTERLIDLSLGGAFISLTGNYQIGTILNLRMAIAQRYVNTTAIVRRVSQNRGVGVQFLDLSPESLQALAAFLETRGALGPPSPPQGFGAAR